jgi:hypothetical protein
MENTEKRQWRFKTEEEFIAQYGWDWRDEVRWVSMQDYLFGMPITNEQLDEEETILISFHRDACPHDAPEWEIFPEIITTEPLPQGYNFPHAKHEWRVANGYVKERGIKEEEQPEYTPPPDVIDWDAVYNYDLLTHLNQREEPKERTIVEWLQGLPDRLIDKVRYALENHGRSGWKWEPYKSLKDALCLCLDWSELPEGIEFWRALADFAEANDNAITEMGYKVFGQYHNDFVRFHTDKIEACLREYKEHGGYERLRIAHYFLSRLCSQHDHIDGRLLYRTPR